MGKSGAKKKSFDLFYFPTDLTLCTCEQCTVCIYLPWLGLCTCSVLVCQSDKNL